MPPNTSLQPTPLRGTAEFGRWVSTMAEAPQLIFAFFEHTGLQVLDSNDARRSFSGIDVESGVVVTIA